MSFNLLDVVKGQFNNELVSKAASFLGENETGVSRALTGAIPAILSGLVAKGSSVSGANEVLSSAKDAHQTGIFSNLSGLLGNGSLLSKGADLLKSLLGDKAAGIINTIAGFAGIKASSATSLMSMAAPAALSAVGKHATENNLGANGLMDLLSSQKSSILNALPGGLSSVAGMFGLGNLAEGATRKVTATYNEVERKAGGGMKWLLPFLLLVAAGLLAWWFLLGGKNGCKAAKDKDAVVTTNGTDTLVNNNGADINVKNAAGKLDSATGEFVYNLGNIVAIDLPNNGGKLMVGENSTEAKLVNFLNDANQLIDTVKGNWFEFTNVKFKTGSADITDESLEQLKNMVAIAKAYPTAQFKFGGYTDNTGDSVKNVALSQKRAEAVASKVKQLGAPVSSVVSAKGYGPQWPIAENNTAEGRSMNRRVAVNVKAR